MKTLIVKKSQDIILEALKTGLDQAQKVHVEYLAKYHSGHEKALKSAQAIADLETAIELHSATMESPLLEALTILKALPGQDQSTIEYLKSELNKLKNLSSINIKITDFEGNATNTLKLSNELLPFFVSLMWR